MSILPYREKPEEPSVRGQGALRKRLGRGQFHCFFFVKSRAKKEKE